MFAPENPPVTLTALGQNRPGSSGQHPLVDRAAFKTQDGVSQREASLKINGLLGSNVTP
jgi:hypothetical protein